MAFTIDDTVNDAAPPGWKPAANVILAPRYMAGEFLPDGSNRIKQLETGHTMAAPVSFDFPAQNVYSSSPVTPR